jgi:hypothetical protein
MMTLGRRELFARAGKMAEDLATTLPAEDVSPLLGRLRGGLAALGGTQR